jgi:hypothetical protein
MQKKQLWILNAALAVFAVLLAMRLAGGWRGGNERYRSWTSAAGWRGPCRSCQRRQPAAAGESSRRPFT